MPTSLVLLALKRLRRFARRRPGAARLARLVSPAVRIEPALLRRMRLALLSDVDAGAEADLWFGALVESHSAHGFVLDPHVANLLRQDLAEEDGGALFQKATALIEAMHRDEPVTIRIEEEIIRLSLNPNAGPETIEAVLRQAVLAMKENTERGLNMARWALRALPRLPRRARESQAAMLMALGASERLGGRFVMTVDTAALAPAEMAWVLPETPDTAPLGLRLYEHAVEFTDPTKPDVLTIDLPRTDPLFVELRWGSGAEEAKTAEVYPGRRVALPPRARLPLTLRTLSGDEYQLSAEPEEAAETGEYELEYSKNAIAVRDLFPDDVRPLLSDIENQLAQNPKQYPQRTTQISETVFRYRHPEPPFEITYRLHHDNRLTIEFMHFAVSEPDVDEAEEEVPAEPVESATEPYAEFTDYATRRSTNYKESLDSIPKELLATLFEIEDGLADYPDQFPERTIPIQENIYIYRHPEPEIEITYQIDREKQIITFLHVATPRLEVRQSLFISYSHEDTRWFEQLKEVLNPFEQRNLLRYLNDELRASENWLDALEKALAPARAAIILVSQNYLDSKFSERELRLLLDKARKEDLRLFWIAVSISFVEETELGIYQALSDPSSPLDMLDEEAREETYFQIYQQLQKVLDV